MNTREKLNKFVNEIEKKSELIGVLNCLLYHKMVTTYVPVAAILGFYSGGSALAGMLEEVMIENHKKGLPFISSVVVGAQTRIPGNGYFSCARKLGYEIGKDHISEFLFWAAQMKLLGMEIPEQSSVQAQELGITIEQIENAETLSK